MRAAIVDVRLIAAALGDHARLQKDAGEETAGGCRINLFDVSVEGFAAGGLVERFGGLFENLRAFLANQTDERLAEPQAGLDILTGSGAGGLLLESRDFRTKLQGFARGRVALGERTRARGAATAQFLKVSRYHLGWCEAAQAGVTLPRIIARKEPGTPAVPI